MTNRWHWDNAEQMIVSAADNSHLAIEDFIMFTNGVEREREQLRAHNARLGALVTEETAALLDTLADMAVLIASETEARYSIDSPLAVKQSKQVDEGHALAARIRETLALEATE